MLSVGRNHDGTGFLQPVDSAHSILEYSNVSQGSAGRVSIEPTDGMVVLSGNVGVLTIGGKSNVEGIIEPVHTCHSVFERTPVRQSSGGRVTLEPTDRIIDYSRNVNKIFIGRKDDFSGSVQAVDASNPILEQASVSQDAGGCVSFVPTDRIVHISRDIGMLSV